MKKLLLSAILLTSMAVTAQLKLPSSSPAATFTQTVGTTDLTVSYSRPSMKGREIFGKLLPYGKIWRTGANGATQLTASTDIMVEGQKLTAGTYSIFSIPNDGEITIIFNKDKGASEQSYAQDKDALRVNVKTVAMPMAMQTLGMWAGDLTDSTTSLNIAWEKTMIPIKIMVDVNGNVDASITKATNESSSTMMNAANYLLGKGKNLEQALKYSEAAIGVKETFRNVAVKANILSKLGRYAEALPFAQKALALGSSDTSGAFGFMKEGIEKSIAEISSKIPPVVDAVKGKLKKK